MVLLSLFDTNALEPLIWMPIGFEKVFNWPVVDLQAPRKGPESMGQLITSPGKYPVVVANMYPECISISKGFSRGKRYSQPENVF